MNLDHPIAIAMIAAALAWLAWGIWLASRRVDRDVLDHAWATIPTDTPIHTELMWQYRVTGIRLPDVQFAASVLADIEGLPEVSA